jgi:hypothetical protein
MIRHKYVEAVKGMWIPGSFLTTPGSGLGISGRAVARSDDRDSMMDPLLPGEASPWSDDGVSLFDARNFDLGRHSYVRDPSLGPSGRAASIHAPSITVSYDEGGEDIGLLAFDHINSRRPRPRTNS